MSGARYQWRAVGIDRPSGDDPVYDRDDWTTESEARNTLRTMTDAFPPFDEVVLERRTVTYGVPEVVPPTPRAEAER